MPETDRPLTPEERQEAERLCADATPGPWTVNVEVDGSDEIADADSVLIDIPEISRALHDTDWADDADRERDLANARFIAAARALLPRALATITALERQLDEARANVEIYIAHAKGSYRTMQTVERASTGSSSNSPDSEYQQAIAPRPAPAPTTQQGDSE